MQTPNELLPDALQMDLLWTNAVLASTFESQTISLDLSKYRFVAILYYLDSNRSCLTCLYFFTKTNSEQAVSVVYDQLGYGRRVGSITDNSISFNNAVRTNFSDGAYFYENNGLVPYKIYGVK